MLSLIVKMLEIGELIGVSENIDIAKGKYKMPTTLKEGWNQRKRNKAWQ